MSLTPGTRLGPYEIVAPIGARTRQPIGPLTAVAHFHRARQQVVGTSGNPQRLDMSPTGLVFAMAERHGNIWMATVKK